MLDIGVVEEERTMEGSVSLIEFLLFCLWWVREEFSGRGEEWIMWNMNVCFLTFVSYTLWMMSTSKKFFLKKKTSRQFIFHPIVFSHGLLIFENVFFLEFLNYII